MFLSLDATVFIIPEPSRLLCSRVRASVLIFKFFFFQTVKMQSMLHTTQE